MDTYEKKYKESLDLMVDCIPDEDGYVHVRPQDIFPELKGSRDEKIRKTLIDFFQDWRKNRSHCWGISVPEILTWLEKQGTSYTKKDVDDAFVEGMAFAKNELEKQSEQKPAWSEEDEVRLQACIDCLQAESLMGKVDTVMTNWLKSLKERIGGKL